MQPGSPFREFARQRQIVERNNSFVLNILPVTALIPRFYTHRTRDRGSKYFALNILGGVIPKIFSLTRACPQPRTFHTAIPHSLSRLDSRAFPGCRLIQSLYRSYQIRKEFLPWPL